MKKALPRWKVTGRGRAAAEEQKEERKITRSKQTFLTVSHFFILYFVDCILMNVSVYSVHC